MNPNQNTVLTIATASLCSVVAVAAAAFAQKTKPSPIVVKSSDIPSKVVIESALGHPIGTLLTIRGTWDSTLSPKDAHPFVVETVNGIHLREPVLLHDAQVVPFRPVKGGPVQPWDWKMYSEGNAPPPEPKLSERWEMLGMETGRYVYPSPEFWKETGNVQEGGLYGFYTRFEFIAIKKLSPPRGER
jgi:hypothetical protein